MVISNKESAWRGWVNQVITTSGTTATNACTANKLVWESWTSGTTATSNSITCGTSDPVWRIWVDHGTGGTTLNVRANNSAAVWSHWIDMNDRAQIIRPHAHVPRIESAEDIAARRRIEEEARIAAAKREEERKVAKTRARKLLVENLTPQQRDTYERHGYFDVQVAGRTFRIHQGTHGNVKLLTPQGQTEESYCVQPSGVPDEDAMLAQKLALELAPGEFFRQANVTTYLPNGNRGYRPRGLPAFMAQA